MSSRHAAAPQSVEELEELLSRPTPRVVETLGRLDGDLLLLGVGGKMGPSLARMARRSFDLAGGTHRVIGVSRFGSRNRTPFAEHGIETIACDLLDEDQVARLPDAANIIVMTGRKFGSTGDEPTTWAMNAWLPAIVCRRFPLSRLVVFSTGNVYGLTDHRKGGSREEDQPSPVGEYAQSCLARERMYEYFGTKWGIPLAIIRLNYACDLRYGVLVDLALKVRSGRPVDLAMGWFNTIWQRDANSQTLCAFDHLTTPPWFVNVTGPEQLSVRTTCLELGRLWGVPTKFEGTESESALLSRVERATACFEPPTVSADELLGWVAHWVERGLPTLGKPTHFESRTGRF